MVKVELRNDTYHLFPVGVMFDAGEHWLRIYKPGNTIQEYAIFPREMVLSVTVTSA
jgi:hypothetical protein